MLFNSYVFILLFLPLVWIIYFGLNHFHLYRLAQAALIVASFLFYGYADYKLCFLLAGTILLNYAIHLLLTGRHIPQIVKNLILFLGITANLGLLFYFKYINFIPHTLNRVLHTDFALKNIVLPLGISFFTFQQISFIIDSSKKEMKRYSFPDYALFVAFFPQLVAGPIVLHQELVPQFSQMEKKKVNWQNMMAGTEYFILGLAKKVLLADAFARICDAGYANLNSLNSYSACLTALAFTLQIYFDFSGYCDMALGLGRLFNFELPINFHSPYKSVTIAEFWKKWHMTLTRFLTTYLYIPLGGNRKGRWRTYLNIMIVFTVSGLWHGADWNFVLWGMMHGAMLVLYRLGKTKFDRLPKWLLGCATFLFVNFAWTFFRADYFKQPLDLLHRALTGGLGGVHPAMLEAACGDTLWMTFAVRFIPAGMLPAVSRLAVLLQFVLWTGVCVFLPSSHEIVAKKIRTTKHCLLLGLLFVWSFISLSQVTKFIYFNF